MPTLEELKKEKFVPEGKPERVAKALEALYQESAIDLPLEALKQIAEDSAIEDLFSE